jgi:glucosamine--fructose-6-phosphate aminotransferase (isomerizing)
MRASEFHADVMRKLENLAILHDAHFDWPDVTGKRLLLVGMGSSYFAASTMAHRLQMAGVNAYATLASVKDMPRLGSGDVVIAISATGRSLETVSFAQQVAGNLLFLTNNPEADTAKRAQMVSMNSLSETGGVASLTYQATLVALLRLEEQLTGKDFVDGAISRSEKATGWMLDNREDWQGLVGEFAGAPEGTQFVAPVERWASAHQSALMFREGPRLRSHSSETGDWAHIDVYLTKNHDIRFILFSGSPWQEQFLDWTSQRSRRTLIIGGSAAQADSFVEYPHQEDGVVALLTETTFAELVAAQLWSAQR